MIDDEINPFEEAIEFYITASGEEDFETAVLMILNDRCELTLEEAEEEIINHRLRAQAPDTPDTKMHRDERSYLMSTNIYKVTITVTKHQPTKLLVN